MSSKQNQWIVGVNAVASAVEHDAEHVREVLVDSGARNPRLVEIEEQARRRGIEVRKVAAQALDGISGNVRHQGVAARYAAVKTWDEHELAGLVEAAEGKALLLVLDGVQDPHNLGACLRSAAAAGATAVVIPKDKSAPVNATVRKTSAGAADRLPVVSVTNLSRTLRELQKLGVWIYGLAGEAEPSLYSLDLKGNVALVLGGEAEGLRRDGVTVVLTTHQLTEAEELADHIVIIDHGQGWTSLVTGLAQLTTAVGAELVAGSPLGTAGPGRPVVSLELRRQGEPVNPIEVARP